MNEKMCAVSADFLVQQARLLCKYGEFESAEITLREVLEKDRLNTKAIHWLEVCLGAQDRFGEAIQFHEYAALNEVA